MVKISAMMILSLATTGCGFVRTIWGESAPVRETVILRGEALPKFTLIFSENDQTANEVLDIWRDSALKSFTIMEGKQKDFLATAEVKTLIRRGLIKLNQATSDDAILRVSNIMELLGFKDGIARHNVEDLFNWLGHNRKEARRFYQLISETEGAGPQIRAKDLVSLLNLFGSFAELTGDQIIETPRMADLVMPFIPPTYPHAKAALQSGIELGVEFFASFCGDRVNRKRWHGNKVGACLHDVTAQFAPYSPLFDFMFGTLNPITERRALQTAALGFPEAVDDWLDGHAHPLFKTERVSHFADALEIPPPYAFVRLTEWIPKLNSDSTSRGFSPLFFKDLSKLVQAWTQTTLQVTQSERCAARDWTTCAFNGEYAPADQLFHAEYASLIRAKNLGFVRKIALYDTLAGFIMKKFDSKNEGYVSGQIEELINISIRLLDTNAFAQNVINRVQEKPVDPSNTEDSLKDYRRRGLSELAAMAADLIPERARDPEHFSMKMQDQVTHPNSKSAYSIDQLGLTSFLYLSDLISQLRDEYINNYALSVRKQGSLSFVKRKSAIEVLPRFLFDHFPNVFQECKEWGFERSCGVVFTEILPGVDRGTDEIQTYELDVVTLSTILLQSMMNRCDRDDDGLLSSKLFDGNDEKRCMIDVASALGNRLMRANIVKEEPKTEKLLDLVNQVPLLRWAAKTALSRGNTGGIWWRGLAPFTFLSGPATLGSVVSLAAQFMSAEKVKAIDDDKMGPISSPGDELIYHHQLTHEFLPAMAADPEDENESDSQ